MEEPLDVRLYPGYRIGASVIFTRAHTDAQRGIEIPKGSHGVILESLETRFTVVEVNGVKVTVYAPDYLKGA